MDRLRLVLAGGCLCISISLPQEPSEAPLGWDLYSGFNPHAAPACTSRTCSMCGQESAENRKTKSVFSCVACGHTEHGDVHAARNILAAGRAAWLQQLNSAGAVACGEAVSRGRSASAGRAASTKQGAAEAKVLA